MFYLGILRQFSGYTLKTLRDEDPELLRMMYIEHLGTGREGGGQPWQPQFESS